MKLPNGYGSVVKLSGKRRKPWMVRKTTGYRIDPVKEKKVNEYIIIGYAATKTEGLQILADYNRNPYDTKAAKMTFDEVYEEWSKKKFPTVSESNIKGYKASYKTCGILYNRIFKDLKLADLQQVIDTCGKNFPTLKKIKILFNQLYEFALKNDICNKDYSTFVEIAQYKDRNPNKHTRTKFTKEKVAKVWTMKEDKYYQIILMLLYNGTRISEFLDLKKENVHLEEQYFDVIDSKTEKFRSLISSCLTIKTGIILVLIVNIFFIQRMAKDFFIAITMTAIGLLLWNRLELTVRHIVPGIPVFPCYRKLVFRIQQSRKLWGTPVL